MNHGEAQPEGERMRHGTTLQCGGEHSWWSRGEHKARVHVVQTAGQMPTLSLTHTCCHTLLAFYLVWCAYTTGTVCMPTSKFYTLVFTDY